MKEHFNAISWRIFCKSLGEKVTDNDSEADVACIIRAIYVLIMTITSAFIVAGVIRHWN